MDPNAAHQLLIRIIGAPLTAYAISIPLAAAHAQNGVQFDRVVVSNLIRANANWVAVVPNQPVLLDTNTHLTVICIKHADADNNVFANIPNIAVLRSNWRVLFVNAAGGEVRGRTQTDAGGSWKNFSIQRDATRGLVHARTVEFKQYFEDNADDAADDADDAADDVDDGPDAAPAAGAGAPPAPGAGGEEVAARAIAPIDPTEPLRNLILARPAAERNATIEELIARLNELKVDV